MPGPLRLIEQVQLSWPHQRWRAFRVLVAVSGGRDSVALLRALKQISDSADANKTRVFAGHFNHQTRGPESQQDEKFVTELCAELGVPVVTGYPSVETGDDEASLRELRYQFLQQSAREFDCRYIATGHHAADQVETVLFRVFRGTGIGGLAGIPMYRVVDDSITIVRPMLECMPADIDAAMKHWRQDFRDDASNSQSRYARNFLRNEVLPDLQQRFGDKLFPNVLRLARQADQTVDFLQGLATVAMGSSVTFADDGSVVVDCQAACHVDKVVLRQMFVEVFRRQGWPLESIGFEELQRLAELVSKPDDVPAFDLPGAVSCRKSADRLLLAR